MEKKKINPKKSLFIEIGKSFVNMIFGNVYSKIGLSLILLVPGIGFLFMSESQKPKHNLSLLLIGILYILVSIILIFKRYFELKLNKECEK